VFGVFLADYFVLQRRSVEALYETRGIYWQRSGFGILAIAVWVAGFFLYAFAAQPQWLLQNFDFVSWVPDRATQIGGTIPALVFSFGVYAIIGRFVLMGGDPAVTSVASGSVQAEA
jgi:cytosine/uracil/thiamine/allantoin permease